MTSKRRTTELGWLILRAMDAKGAERGEHYGYQQLGQDAGYDGSNVARIVKGQRQPSRELLEAIAKALAPHLDRDQAMLLAGYVPVDGQAASAVGEFVRLLRRAPEEAERWLRLRAFEAIPPAEQGAEQERHGQREGEGRRH